MYKIDIIETGFTWVRLKYRQICLYFVLKVFRGRFDLYKHKYIAHQLKQASLGESFFLLVRERNKVLWGEGRGGEQVLRQLYDSLMRVVGIGNIFYARGRL